MIQRLRNMNHPPGSSEAELAQAVGAMDPVEATAARQQQILAAVVARGRRRRWSAAVLLRPAVAGAILLAAGAGIAGATVGPTWMVRQWHRLTTPPTADPTPAAPAAVVAVPARRPDPPPRETPETLERPRLVRPIPPRAATHPVARVEDPTALVQAVRALRRDHDPRRAARLVDAYMRTYPRGALAEEALALQIEAASAQQSPRAADFAREYLRLYPTGRFRAPARQALDASRD